MSCSTLHPRETPHPSADNLSFHLPPLQPPVPQQPLICFLSLNSPILDISHKRNILCGLHVWLLSLQRHVSTGHPYCGVRQCFTPFYDGVRCHCVDTPRCVYPFTSSWPLRDSSFLTIVNNAAMNVSLQIFVGTYYPPFDPHFFK